MAGYCTQIDVTLLADGGVRVADNGRGIPIGPMKEHQGKSAAEVVLTVLHAGGKFGEGGGYKVSGGLHGVGVSVVNALSTRLLLEIDLDGDHHVLEFVDGGNPTGKLEITGRAPRGRTGTTVTFWPDPTIFEEVEFRAQTVMERLQVMAFLNKGLEIRFADERPDGKDVPGLQVQGRHRRLRPPPQRVQRGALPQGRLARTAGGDHGGGDRPPVEHRLLREHPLVRQRHLHHRRRHARGGVQEVPHQCGQQVRTGQGHPQGEGRQPPGRGHPRGPDRDHLGPSRRILSSKVRRRPSSATSRFAPSSSGPPTRS